MQLNEDRDKLKMIIGKDLNNKIQVKIGEEQKDLSVITTSYSYGNKIIGVLGIIGPKRMEYEKMISLVDSVSKVVNGYLSQIGEEDDDE
jgi:heat-inducible transcriptional repressor